MLFLLCQAGNDRFALRVRDVVELVPNVLLAAASASPAWLVGLLDYRGRPVAVLDLSQLAAGRPCQQRYRSRIVLLRVPGTADQLFGLRVERATTAQFDETTFQPTNAGLASGMLFDPQGLVQVLDCDRLLPPERQALVFPETTTLAAPMTFND
jgi:chemotaxis-related protein WspB